MFLTLSLVDILLNRNTLEIIKATKYWLSSIFEMKDMVETRYILDVEIIRNHHKKLVDMCKVAYIKVLE